MCSSFQNFQVNNNMTKLTKHMHPNTVSDGDNWKSIPLINRWRVRADGKQIIHVPLVLYSDDTSGNVSKKWNKHMSFYCTLAGLPPKLTNQDYNIHFISASNTASSLELIDGLADELV